MGVLLGILVGAFVGFLDGALVGVAAGGTEGVAVGAVVGAAVGAVVGAAVGKLHPSTLSWHHGPPESTVNAFVQAEEWTYRRCQQDQRSCLHMLKDTVKVNIWKTINKMCDKTKHTQTKTYSIMETVYRRKSLRWSRICYLFYFKSEFY